MKLHELECPICNSSLKSWESKSYSTWADEIADPNGEMSDYTNRPTMICNDDKCILGREKPVGFWVIMGDWYWEKWVDEENRKIIKEFTIDENLTALYGSSRVIFGEKSKHSSYLNLYWMQFYFEWELKCEPKYGKVIGIKNFKLSCCKRDKDGRYYKYTSEFHRLKYYFRKFYRSKKEYKIREYNPEAWYVKDLKESFSLNKYGGGWSKHFSVWFFNKFERKIYNSILALELLGEK